MYAYYTDILHKITTRKLFNCKHHNLWESSHSIANSSLLFFGPPKILPHIYALYRGKHCNLQCFLPRQKKTSANLISFS